jgi:hypothetical protein
MATSMKIHFAMGVGAKGRKEGRWNSEQTVLSGIQLALAII